MLDTLFRYTGIAIWSIILLFILVCIMLYVKLCYDKLEPWYYVVVYYLMSAKKLDESFKSAYSSHRVWRRVCRDKRKALQVQRFIIIKRIRKYRLKQYERLK